VKKIEAIIRPDRLDAVKEALSGRGITGITVCHARGEGSARPHRLVYRCTEYAADLPRVKLEFVVGPGEVDDAVQAVTEAAWTGEIDDGQLYVSDVSEVIRVFQRGAGARSSR
jgi:nitrogen regulatory protein P-II 1